MLLTVDLDADLTLEELRATRLWAGENKFNNDIWYSEHTRTDAAKGFEGRKIESGQFCYVFISAGILEGLWIAANCPDSDLTDLLREYVLTHEQALRFCGGIEMVMCDFFTPTRIATEPALLEKGISGGEHPTRRKSRLRDFASR